MTENITKHQQLVNSICDGVDARIRPLFEALTVQSGTESAHLYTVVAAIGARIEVLEKTCISERLPLSERKTAQPDSDDPHTKVKNSMLYVRRMWADSESFRDKYHSAAVQAEIDNDKKTSKEPLGSESRLLNEGRLFWNKCASVAQKQEFRHGYGRWRDARRCAQIGEPLSADVDREEDE